MLLGHSPQPVVTCAMPRTLSTHTLRLRRWSTGVLLGLLFVAMSPAYPAAQITATARPDATPTWYQGILPISSESYYHAIECGKQGGDDPPCVFWDTGLCKNDDFELSAYTAYKQIAYQVWQVVRSGRPAPQPDFYAAQNTRVTIGVSSVQGSGNTLTDLTLIREGTSVNPVDRNVRDGRFTFDYPAWAPTTAVTLEIVGDARTISCTIDPGVLQQFR